MHMELNKLRAIKSLRQEYNTQLECEKQQARWIKSVSWRTRAWMDDLREQFKRKKQQCEDRISELKSKLGTQEEPSSEHGARVFHCFQPAADRGSVDGYGGQPAVVEIGTRAGTVTLSSSGGERKYAQLPMY